MNRIKDIWNNGVSRYCNVKSSGWSKGCRCRKRNYCSVGIHSVEYDIHRPITLYQVEITRCSITEVKLA